MSQMWELGIGARCVEEQKKEKKKQILSGNEANMKT